MVPSPGTYERFVRLLARAAALAAAAIAALAVAGWAWEAAHLTSWGPGLPPMYADTAIAALAASAALALTLDEPVPAWRMRLAWGLSAIVAAIGALFLVRVAVGAAPPITEVLGWGSVVPAAAGYVTAYPMASLMLLLLAIALATVDLPPVDGVRPADVPALIAGALGAAPILAYTADLDYLRDLVAGLGMALPTSVAGWLLASGVLLARPGRGVASVLVARGPGGAVARRLLPAVMAVPLAIVATDALLARARIAGTAVGTSLLMLALMGLGFFVVLWAAHALERADAVRRRQEAALRDREARLSALIESAHDAIFLLDEDGRVTAANLRAEALYGRRRPALIGRRLDELQEVPAGGGGGPTAAAGQAPDTVREEVGRRADGTPFPTEVVRSRIETPTGVFRVAAVRDITERKRAAEALAATNLELARSRALDRLKDHVFSSISHEMKTPLALIQGYAELLADRLPGDELVAGMEDGVRRLTAQIEAMLDHAALLGGDMPLYIGEVDPAELVAALAARCGPAAEAKGVAFTTAVAPVLPVLAADRRRLDQAVAALVDNAIKFTPAGGRATLAARQEGGELVFEVADTGPGVPDALREHLGETFRQADLGDADRKGGIGLGLAIARMIAELHGGRLTIASAPGVGSVFAIRVPIVTQPG